MNILWLVLGLVGVLLKFWAGVPEDSTLSALFTYIGKHQRSTMFSVFTYLAIVAIWYTQGISFAGIVLEKGILSGWLVPIGYFSTTLFDDVAKNLGKKVENTSTPQP